MTPTAPRLVLQIALLAGAYYVAPAGERVAGAVLWLRVGGSLVLLAGLAAISLMVSRRVAREVRGPEATVRVGHLVLATTIGLAVFALADLIVATAAPDEFVDLRTKTDALYFAMATLTTIGYGDIHAEGQVARGLVILQMLFNAIVLATAVRTGLKAAADRRT